MSVVVGVLVFGVGIPCVIAALFRRRVRGYLVVGFLISIMLALAIAVGFHGTDDDDTARGSFLLGISVFGSMYVVYVGWACVFFVARWASGRGRRWGGGDEPDREKTAASLPVGRVSVSGVAFLVAAGALALGFLIPAVPAVLFPTAWFGFSLSPLPLSSWYGSFGVEWGSALLLLLGPPGIVFLFARRPLSVHHYWALATTAGVFAAVPYTVWYAASGGWHRSFVGIDGFIGFGVVLLIGIAIGGALFHQFEPLERTAPSARGD